MPKQGSEPNAVHQLISEYDRLFRLKFGFPAPIVRGKDHKLAKQLLERYELRQLVDWLVRFFEIDDAFVRQSGYTFGVFVACLGKIITSKPNRRNDGLQGLRDFIDG